MQSHQQHVLWCCACCVLERAWETGEKQKEDKEKCNLLANAVVKCYLSFLQYLHWQSFIGDLWPSVLQIYCICCGFCKLKLLWKWNKSFLLCISEHLTFRRIRQSFVHLLTTLYQMLPSLISGQ